MYIVGIAGGSGSGKTTFVSKLKNIVESDISCISMDSYYLNKLPVSLMHEGEFNFDHPDAIDWQLLLDHIKSLKNGEPIYIPKYDFETNSRLNGTEMIYPSKILILEGIFALFNEQIREFLDIKCFLHVDADIRFIRRLHRDVKERARTIESVTHQYYKFVRPMHKKYIDPQTDFADITVGEETDIAADILASKIKSIQAQTYSDQENEKQSHL